MSATSPDRPIMTPDRPHDPNDSEDQNSLQEHRYVKKILTDYLQPDSPLSLDDAVSEVAPLWNPKHEFYVNPVLAVPVAIAERIPYDDPTHKKLAKFMLAVHNSGQWIAEDKIDQKEHEQRIFWIRFGQHLFDNDWSPEENIETEADYHYMAYANICAFIANLEFPKTSGMKFDHTMAKVALTHLAMLDSSFATEVREARIVGAAQYILFHSQHIFEEVILDQKWEANVPRDKGCFARLRNRKPLPPRPTIAGIDFTLDEWKGWKDMFRTAVADETLGQKCRDIAQRAADLMSLQEKVDNDRSIETSAVQNVPEGCGENRSDDAK